jgi:hypothetical protein
MILCRLSTKSQIVGLRTDEGFWGNGGWIIRGRLLGRVQHVKNRLNCSARRSLAAVCTSRSRFIEIRRKSPRTNSSWFDDPHQGRRDGSGGGGHSRQARWLGRIMGTEFFPSSTSFRGNSIGFSRLRTMNHTDGTAVPDGGGSQRLRR